MKPNLFILGSGKCGTTSLFNILGRHHEIHASAIKEPCFFCDYFRIVNDENTYYQLFDSPARYRMEASHVYFSNPPTAPALKELFPNAKFIITLRHPKNRAYSLFRHMRRAIHADGQPLEDLPDFAAALRAEAHRYASTSFFKNCRQYFWNFMYCRSSLYDLQLRRYFSLFHRDQFHILSLAELASDPASTTGKIAAFLDLDQASLPQFDFQVSNHGGPYEPFCAKSNKLMDAAFAGLTERTDHLVGRHLDWSM
jgi:hypothetical protein